MRAPHIIVRSLLGLITFGGVYLFLMMPPLIDKVWQQRSLNIVTWPNCIDRSYFEPFEKKMGIRINLLYMDNYEELLIKLRSGTGDYDLVMVADYMVQPFVAAKIVKPFDHAKFNHWRNFDPQFLNLPFDRGNKYSIPYGWNSYGLGIDLAYYGGTVPDLSWSLLFDPAIAPHRVSMLDDARENFTVAMMYLFGDIFAPTQEQLQAITDVLIAQKQWVVAYTDLSTDFLLKSKAAQVSLGMSSDFFSDHSDNNPDIIFRVPKEGGFLMVDNFLLPASTKKDDVVYAFLNYLYQKEVMTHYVDHYYFCPVVKDLPIKNQATLDPIMKDLPRLRLFEPIFNEEQLRMKWITLKS